MRINDRIRVPEVRVIYGEINLVMQTRIALQKAKALGLDLVEIASTARPPVCKIVDYGKWKYEQAKLKRDKKPNKVKEKEIKFRVGIDPHDYLIKLTRSEDFLAHGYKLRLQLQFRGRENAHKELGFEMMNKVRLDLLGMAHIDLEPKLNNRSILMMVSPLPPSRQVPKFRKAEDRHNVDLDAHDEAEAADHAQMAEEDGSHPDDHHDEHHEDHHHEDDHDEDHDADDDGDSPEVIKEA